MGFLQSQVAPLFEKDMAQPSKIEKGLRQLKREQIPIFADILKASQISAVLKEEKLALQALNVTESEVKMQNKKSKK